MELHWNQVVGSQDSWMYFALSFTTCLLLLPVVSALARKVGLVDRPTERKNHIGSTPLVGGICIYISVCVVLLLVGNAWELSTFLFWMLVVLCVGVLDDLLDIAFAVRILVHSIVVLGLWMGDGLVVKTVGSIVGLNSDVTFTLYTGLAFTVFAVIGAINSVNMIDGVDGLLGSLVLVSLLSVLLIVKTTQTNVAGEEVLFPSLVLVVLIGSVAGFLIGNARLFKGGSAMVFLGDAGSTLLGFMLVYILIDYSHGSESLISPVIAGWLLGLPLLDASSVIAIRLIKRRSPFAPAHDHMHHILLARGHCVNSVVFRMLMMHAAMIFFAMSVTLLVPYFADLVLFWGFIILVGIRFLFGIKLDSISNDEYQRSFEEYQVPNAKLENLPGKGSKRPSSSGKMVA